MTAATPHDAGEPCFADRASFATVEVAENVLLAKDTWRVRFHCPAMARRFAPGQFLMMRLADFEDPLLARPLALYDTADDAGGEPQGIDVVYIVMGKMTSRLADFSPGRKLNVWGPLGNAFPLGGGGEHLIMVAGGVGLTPFMALARESLGLRRYGDPSRAAPRAGRVSLCYGARRGEYLTAVPDFQRLGVDVRISTDDGSAGHHGFVTDLLADLLQDEPPPAGRRIICCGPLPMMRAVAAVAEKAGVACWASLETPMACGIGICFSCVAKIRDEVSTEADAWDYRRTCVEGPVFSTSRIVW